MRELNSIESQQVSGGVELAFFLSIISGATGCSQSNTIAYSALWGGLVGGVAGLPLFIVGSLVTAPIGFVFGALEGLIGYKIGSLFYHEPKIHQIQIQQQPVQTI